MITPIFNVGQQVVCTNDEFTILLAQDPSIVVPKKNQEYTVKKNYQLLHAVGITLEELDNTHAIPKGRKIEPNFDQSRFRAVQEAKVIQMEKVEEDVFSDYLTSKLAA